MNKRSFSSHDILATIRLRKTIEITKNPRKKTRLDDSSGDL
jgi:hypothetical protein